MTPNTSLERFAAVIEEGAGITTVPSLFQTVAQPWEPEDAAIPLSHYLWVLRRNRWKILTFIAVCVASTLIVSKRLTPIYESTVTVDVDRRVPTGIIGQEATQSSLNDSDQFLATQVKLIQSDAVLRPVVDEFHLRQREGRQPAADPARVAEAPVILKKLKVTRAPNTYLLQISYRSPDPVLAAGVANAVARSYVEHTYNIRFRSSASLSTFMEKQLEELRAKMERSNAALAQFEKELNVINPLEKTNILSARLLQLNTDYTNAQTERVKKEAAYGSVSSGTLESELASTQGEALKKLMERLDQAQEKFAQVRAHYGANHPEYRKADTQLREVREQFEAGRRNVARRVEVEYREAIYRESTLKKAVTETKAEFDHLNARSFEYDALKREAEADRKLYQELVTKIREAGINAGFQSSTVRIADNARPGLKPVFPNLPLNLALAFLFSTVVAVAGAVVSDTLDTTVRDIEHVSRIARTEVIGGLPQVRRWKGRLALTGPGAGPNGASLIRRHDDDRMERVFEEAIGTLRNTILLGSFDRRIRSLLVTSATPGEGKSTIAMYLARAHAQQKHKTLLIDCDLRRPSLERKMSLHVQTGLSDVLLHDRCWREAVTEVAEPDHLYVLPTRIGSRRAAELVGRALPQILEEAAAEYDLVIVDAPPALGFPEPIQMATAVDGVIVIALAGQTERKALASVVSTMTRLRANVVGVALNEVTKDLGAGYYYYGYYGKHYSKYYKPTKG